MAPAAGLVRVVRLQADRLEVGRHLPGRGAWLCPGSAACVAAAERRGAFSRALRGPVEPEAVHRLRAELVTGQVWEDEGLGTRP
ncbi:MAG: YlxR family protein [Acidimicrobiales bacterium]